MDFTAKVTATQLLVGQLFFADLPVRGLIKSKQQDENGLDVYIGEAFALVPYKGTELKVSIGDWLVEYSDGTLEVHNSDSMAANFDKVDPDEQEYVITQEDLLDHPEMNDFIKAGESVVIKELSEEEQALLNESTVNTGENEKGDGELKEGEKEQPDLVDDKAAEYTEEPKLVEPEIALKQNPKKRTPKTPRA